MLKNFVTHSSNALKIHLITTEEFSSWMTQQNNPKLENWLKINDFTAKSGETCFLLNNASEINGILLGLKNPEDYMALAKIPTVVNSNDWELDLTNKSYTPKQLNKWLIAWGLGSYKFNKYKQAENTSNAQLVIPNNCDFSYVENIIKSIFLVRDLINEPAEYLNTERLAEIALEYAQLHQATNIQHYIGNELLSEKFPLVHAVGRASDNPPRFVEFTWGDINHPKLAIVGKGICFDSGGLNLKPTSAMEKMKKDMAGVAHALGLANMIMTAKLPVHLHVLLPIAENLVAGNSLKPGDIITSRNGTTVEITNTDAEGRLLLADALTRACEEKPDLIIDMASLTGAATVALGPEIISMFCNDDEVANNLSTSFNNEQELIWRMPLHQPYTDLLSSKLADVSNCSMSGYAGSITAGLFLQKFVTDKTSWIHLDLMGANVKSRLGHPEGGEAMGLIGLFHYVKNMFVTKKQ